MAVFAYLLAVAIDAAPAADPIAAEAVAPHLYLHPQAAVCDSRAPADEIVVCGSKDADEQFRLRSPDAHRYDDKPIRAEMKLFGDWSLKAHADEVGVGGFTSKRAMITFTLPF